MKAAGILFRTPDDKVLLLRRVKHKQSDEGDPPSFPDTWGLPGGGVEGEETAEAAARRECLEETGHECEGTLNLWARREADQVDFTTFLAVVPEPFVPVLNDEHDAYQWADRSFALSAPNLHPGVYIALRRFELDELGVAKAIVAGDLTSPQRYGKDLMLVALRITGTGASFRSAHDEYVWRDPSLYMTPQFLERCNGLPVILEHPEKSLLNTKEFRKRIVGTIFLPYFKTPDGGDGEVWGIAKILDMDVADTIETEGVSTSPAVLCLGDKVPVIDGKMMLVENAPKLLDHLALLVGHPGVWDKGQGLLGVDVQQDAQPCDDATAAKLDLLLFRLNLPATRGNLRIGD